MHDETNPEIEQTEETPEETKAESTETPAADESES